METNTVMTDPSASPPQPTEAAMVTAYQAVLPEAKALPSEGLAILNLDITPAAGLAFAVSHRLPQYRPEVEKHLSTVIDLAAFDQVGTYALALMQANAICRAASHPLNDLQNLVTRGAQLRQQMLLDVTALVFKGLMDGAVLDNLKGPNGYNNLAVDLSSLSVAMRQSWDKIENKCTSDLPELIEASEIAARLVDAKGTHDLESPVPPEAADIRQRTFTLFIRAYDEIRRAITCLRWKEGDADEIAPSLFSGRGNGRAKENSEPEPTVPATPTPGPIVVPSTAPAATTAPKAVDAPAAGPGQNPFVA
jgi:hypothetical protein